MINLILDTTVFRSDPNRKKVGFETITKLAQSKFIKIHIPHIVYEEFSTSLLSTETSEFESVQKKLKKLERKNLNKSDLISLDNISKEFEIIKNQYLSKVISDFDYWLKSISAIILPIKSHHGSNVVNSYFRGFPPFASVKNRKDFPDAFIFQNVQDLISEVQNVAIISNDENLNKALENIKDADVFKNIDDFINSEQIKKNLFDEFGRIYFDEVKKAIESRSNFIETYLNTNLIDRLIGENFELNIFVKNVDASINDVKNISNTILDTDNAIYFGKGILGFTISFECDATVTYDIESEHYDFLENERTGIISLMRDSRNYYLDVEEKVGLYFEVFLTIQLFHEGSDVLIENVKMNELLENAKIEIDEIDNIELTT